MSSMGRKAAFAGLACALWMVGFDVAPLAHMLLHETLDAHHHGHHHAATGHHHEPDEEDAPRDPQHGEGSVAHKDLAAQTPAPAVPEVLEALLTHAPTELWVPSDRPEDRRPHTTRARAPPTRTT